MAGESKRIVIQIWKKNTLTYILDPVGNDGQVEKILIFEVNHRDQLWFIPHEISVFGPWVPEVGIV